MTMKIKNRHDGKGKKRAVKNELLGHGYMKISAHKKSGGAKKRSSGKKTIL